MVFERWPSPNRALLGDILPFGSRGPPAAGHTKVGGEWVRFHLAHRYPRQLHQLPYKRPGSLGTVPGWYALKEPLESPYKANGDVLLIEYASLPPPAAYP